MAARENGPQWLRRAGPLSLTEVAQCGISHKLPLSLWKAIFVIYWDGSHRIYFKVFQGTPVCLCLSFFFFSSPTPHLGYCIFLVQDSWTKKEWKCQDLAQIVLTWPLEGNSMLSSTSLLFYCTACHISAEEGDRKHGAWLVPFPGWMSLWPDPALSSPGVCIRCRNTRAGSWTDLLSMGQQPWPQLGGG